MKVPDNACIVIYKKKERKKMTFSLTFIQNDRSQLVTKSKKKKQHLTGSFIKKYLRIICFNIKHIEGKKKVSLMSYHYNQEIQMLLSLRKKKKTHLKLGYIPVCFTQTFYLWINWHQRCGTYLIFFPLISPDAISDLVP